MVKQRVVSSSFKSTDYQILENSELVTRLAEHKEEASRQVMLNADRVVDMFDELEMILESMKKRARGRERLDDVRERYKAMFGKKVFNAWTREEILERMGEKS